MEWPTVTAQTALERLKRGAQAVDVRSPGEFQRGSFPGFTNQAILNDEQRHVVGLTYREQGQAAAIALGLKLVQPGPLVKKWREALPHARAEMRLLTCWRGGLRSRISAQWLGENDFAGVRIAGGYKALRAAALEAFDSLPEFLVLGGLTGSGKTDLLRQLSPVLDLELYANHRGSSFGLALGAQQPTQTTFENANAFALTEPPPLMLVEAESRMVGKCVVPERVKAAMDRSAMVMLETLLEERALRIFAEYVLVPVRAHGAAALQRHLVEALARTQRRLGGLRHQKILTLLNEAFSAPEINLARHTPWIESLLKEYYDPLYAHTITANAERIIFRGDFHAVQDFLTYRLSGRGS